MSKKPERPAPKVRRGRSLRRTDADLDRLTTAEAMAAEMEATEVEATEAMRSLLEARQEEPDE